MTVPYTKEMYQLLHEIMPWYDGLELREDTPPEIIEKKKRFDKLYQEQYDAALAFLLDTM